MFKSSGKFILSLMIVALLVTVTSLGVEAFSSEPSKTEHNLTIMGTTDIHQHIMPYNYMSDEVDETIGFAKVYTLIEEIRSNKDNTVLISNGDLISGSLIGSQEAQLNPLKLGETQTIVKIYNKAGYDAAAVGNHELQDYEMDFFELARDGAKFPWLSANIKLAGDKDRTYVKPYQIIEKEVDGKKLKVGIIGFTPPQTIRWGSGHLKGNIIFEDIVESAKEYMPELKKKADIVIAAAHTGISTAGIDSYDGRENAAYYLSQVDGIDAMILGHQHGKLPGGYEGIKGINSKEGTINGVPAVMPSSWGSALGVIDLELVHQAGEWKVTTADSKLKEINETVKPHPMVKRMAQKIHQDTTEYVRTPLGKAERDIYSYVSRIMDSSVTQIINDAQIWWAKREFSNGKFSDLPILSAAAPFRAGREDAEYFTEVEKGDITIGDVTDIYIYENQIRVMKLNGKQVIEWLERSAENFNQIDPKSSERQQLLNSEFSAYNYDVIEGIEYEIDVTKPVGERIVNARYKGKPLNSNQEFLVVTNDYRAGGGGDFPPCVKEDPVYAPSGVVNRNQIIKYIQTKGRINPEPTNNWRIKPVEVEKAVTFRSHPDASEYFKEYGINGVKLLETDENGMGVYKLDMTK
ncbi:hypothetical protein JCM16358_07930 [Halanaerocella petrolearia]